ncbi:MAG: helix-turn-helix domain-containing protein [Treponema sp.]|jgi:AraC-like DNA-binding protein/ligand-binding sensor protein|nr:helix-turn-helix domain-containing protein [Treponema sp.]
MSGDLTTSLAQETVINRREIEPLFLEAQQLMEWYEKASGCETLIHNADGSSVSQANRRKSLSFCVLCRSCSSGSSDTCNEDECPCAQLHKEAQLKAERGGVYVYACKLGFSYWTSPLYAGFRYAGSLVSGQVLAVSRKEAMERFKASFGIPKEKISSLLSAVPEKTHEEIHALAGLLMICAGKLSIYPRNNAPTIQRTSGKKSTEKTTETVQENRDKSRALFQEKERTLLAALRRGDMKAVQKSLDELLDMVQKTGNMDFIAIKYKFIEQAASLSRSAGNPGNIENHSRCLGRIQDSANMEELRENLRLYIEYIGTEIFSFRGLRHACALRKAERFIWSNYTRKISLGEIAAASGLSAPYFSSIFKEERGINLSSYLNQLRVEKAAGLLEETGFSLAQIAEACGFEDQNWFSKIFKSRMGMSPGKFREQGNKKIQKEE